MAAIEESGGGGHGKGDGKVRGKKMSTRVDMTPMVDLGFLLITFFMLATTMSKPTSMSLAVPDKTEDQEKPTEPLKASKVLTLFMGDNDDVYYLDGIAADDDKAKTELKTTRYGHDLRTVIFASQKRINAANPKDKDGNEAFVVVIKPTEVSTYKNMVDVLDEMAITKTKRYALVDNLTDSEKEVLGDKIKPKN
ncbi:ExbD/TolR family protein [Dyadobacter fermentans]|uniref:Biopolymer transport protein ExbD/TolR n=1 Tax=Dyadobacter fermentans (strain ATCC 700827 / DSM 18053 / CIP 107007 / KCTC 52180 / NS114) TaxID=471854 RepID=C6VZ54_DYAFD|nr:biopolymer transporter ExbD [Dyadobacter fermentans]ACT95260.1 Biopolymer transport protein ExbD/TolR [Dyadobacter fermentans DSM 18053]